MKTEYKGTIGLTNSSDEFVKKFMLIPYTEYGICSNIRIYFTTHIEASYSAIKTLCEKHGFDLHTVIIRSQTIERINDQYYLIDGKDLVKI